MLKLHFLGIFVPEGINCLANNIALQTINNRINSKTRLKKSLRGTSVLGNQASEKVTRPSIFFRESTDSLE